MERAQVGGGGGALIGFDWRLVCAKRKFSETKFTWLWNRGSDSRDHSDKERKQGLGGTILLELNTISIAQDAVLILLQKNK